VAGSRTSESPSSGASGHAPSTASTSRSDVTSGVIVLTTQAPAQSLLSQSVRQARVAAVRTDPVENNSSAEDSRHCRLTPSVMLTTVFNISEGIPSSSNTTPRMMNGA